MWIQRIWFPNFPNQRTFSHFPPHGRWYSTHTWTHAHKQSGEPFLTSFICVFRSIEVTAVWFALSVCLHRDSGLPQVTSACPTHTSIETVDIVTEWCKAHSESQVFDPKQGCWPTSLHTCTTECVKDAGSFIDWVSRWAFCCYCFKTRHDDSSTQRPQPDNLKLCLCTKQLYSVWPYPFTLSLVYLLERRSPVVFELVSGNKYLIQESVFCKDRLYCHRVSMIMLFTTLSLKFFLKTTCFGFFKFFLNSIFIFIFFSLSFLCCGQSTSWKPSLKVMFK